MFAKLGYTLRDMGYGGKNEKNQEHYLSENPSFTSYPQLGYVCFRR